jgi:hypothetical protein
MSLHEVSDPQDVSQLRNFLHLKLAAPRVLYACYPVHLRFEGSGKPSMLHKCANPDCDHLFLSLSRGKLFLLETDNSASMISGIAAGSRKGRSLRRMERYWLCDGCASVLTLTYERGRGMVTVPLPPGKTRLPAAHLTQMQATAKVFRAELKGAL